MAPQPARYLRLTGLFNSVNQFFALSEVEVFAAPPPPAPELSRNTVNVREAGEGRFFVRLPAAPLAPVVVTVAPVSGDGGVTIQSGAARSFNLSNWNAWQAVTLAAAPDANAAAETAVFRISAPGYADQLVTATTLDDDLGPNLALAVAGATIKGTKASLVDQMIDGTFTSSANYGYSVWTNDPPGTVTLDLQREIMVSRVRLLNWDWACRAQRYMLESSVDGLNWNLLADGRREDHQGWDEWVVMPQAARFVRITGLFSSANQCFVLSEVEVYASQPPPPPPPVELSQENVNVREAGEGRFFVRLPAAPLAPVVVTVTPVSVDSGITIQGGAVRSFNLSNWSTWQAVTLAAAADENAAAETAVFRVSAPGYAEQLVMATTLDEHIGPNLALASAGATVKGIKASQIAQLIDGVHTSSVNYAYTIWTNNPPGTMTLDLHQEVEIARLRLLNWDWVYRVQRYVIESSLDGTNWSVLVDARAEDRQGWDDWEVQQSVRYLRFTGMSNSANQCVVVPEMEVYAAPRPAGRSVARRMTASRPVRGDDLVLPVAVVTSDDRAGSSNGWAAADGDLNTAWTGRAGAGGWYILLTYDPPLEMTNLVVQLAEESATGIQYLHSQDGVEWRDLAADLASQPVVELRYLWLVFPVCDAAAPVPVVPEIMPQLQEPQ